MKVNNRDRDELFINERIRDREVRVISADGEQLGIMSSREALRLAEEANLDLVKISPNAKPPVCKIIDYGKYKYEKTRKEKDAKRKQHTVEIKEIRLSPNIDTNDLTTKVNAARKFLTKGNRVKITLRFRGREMAHMNASAHILTDFANALVDCAVVEKAPRVEGRSMTMFLAEKRWTAQARANVLSKDMPVLHRLLQKTAPYYWAADLQWMAASDSPFWKNS